jgi:hypothetical protein
MRDAIMYETHEDYLRRKLKSAPAKKKEMTEADHQRLALAEEKRQRKMAKCVGVKL